MPKTSKKKKAVKQKRKNRKQLNAAQDALDNKPSAANVERYMNARKRKGTKAKVGATEADLKTRSQTHGRS